MARNVTLRLDEAILRKARHQAVERDQSLSQWVREAVIQKLQKEERHERQRTAEGK